LVEEAPEAVEEAAEAAAVVLLSQVLVEQLLEVLGANVSHLNILLLWCLEIPMPLASVLQVQEAAAVRELLLQQLEEPEQMEQPELREAIQLSIL
jgi:hypothetical protein